MRVHGRSPRGGLNFTAQIRRVCEDMVQRLEPLWHIDLPRVLITFAQARKRVAHGIHASLTPLRFQEGRRWELRDGKPYAIQPVLNEAGEEMLYILTFYLPRFMDSDFFEKLITILHELWHISPEFDGDLRRFEGRCYAHTSSQAEYDAAMAEMAREYLASDPPEELLAFLRLSFRELAARYGAVFGTKVRRPKLTPLKSIPREDA